MTGPYPQFALGQLFSDDALNQAIRIWRDDRDNFHNRVLKEVVEPAMANINKVTGQENDPRFIAYALEYAFMKGGST
jgi:hypothetical protein